MLKAKLSAEGHAFRTETDSEVIAHLIEKLYRGNLEQAVKEALALLKGTYGIVVMHRAHPDELVGARNGSPLVIGVGHGEMFLASDVTAILSHTKQVVYLEDGEVVRITREGFRTTDLRDREVEKKVELISWELAEIEKDGFRYFMEKEICEQPESIERAMRGRIDPEQATAHLGGLNMSSRDLLGVERVKIVAIGTSLNAGLVGSYLLESVARLPCTRGDLLGAALPQPGRGAGHPALRGLPVRRDGGHPLRPARAEAQGGLASSGSATWSAPPSPGNRTAGCTSTPARRSRWPPPRPSPPSSRCSTCSPC